MKAMKPKSTQPCSYCKARATRKVGGIMVTAKFACPEHIAELAKFERSLPKDDGHMSEADCQTWGKL